MASKASSTGWKPRPTRCTSASSSPATAPTPPAPPAAANASSPKPSASKSTAKPSPISGPCPSPISSPGSPIYNQKSTIINPGDATLHLVLTEIHSRLRYLDEVGLGYLTLDRPTRTLSGGEVERVNLTTCLGASLTGTLFVSGRTHRRPPCPRHRPPHRRHARPPRQGQHPRRRRTRASRHASRRPPHRPRSRVPAKTAANSSIKVRRGARVISWPVQKSKSENQKIAQIIHRQSTSHSALLPWLYWHPLHPCPHHPPQTRQTNALHPRSHPPQPAQTRRRHPARPFRLPHRRLRLRQIHLRPRRHLSEPRPQARHGGRRRRRAHQGTQGQRSISPASNSSINPPSPARRAPRQPFSSELSIPSASSSPARPKPRPPARKPDSSPSTPAKAAATAAPATASRRSRCSSSPISTSPARIAREDATNPPPWNSSTRENPSTTSSTSPSRKPSHFIENVDAVPASHAKRHQADHPAPFPARRSRPRLPQARPAAQHPLRRRVPAPQALPTPCLLLFHRRMSTFKTPHPGRTHHRPPLLRHRTSV